MPNRATRLACRASRSARCSALRDRRGRRAARRPGWVYLVHAENHLAAFAGHALLAADPDWPNGRAEPYEEAAPQAVVDGHDAEMRPLDRTAPDGGLAGGEAPAGEEVRVTHMARLNRARRKRPRCRLLASATRITDGRRSGSSRRGRTIRPSGERAGRCRGGEVHVATPARIPGHVSLRPRLAGPTCGAVGIDSGRTWPPPMRSSLLDGSRTGPTSSATDLARRDRSSSFFRSLVRPRRAGHVRALQGVDRPAPQAEPRSVSATPRTGNAVANLRDRSDGRHVIATLLPQFAGPAAYRHATAGNRPADPRRRASAASRIAP